MPDHGTTPLPPPVLKHRCQGSPHRPRRRTPAVIIPLLALWLALGLVLGPAPALSGQALAAGRAPLAAPEASAAPEDAPASQGAWQLGTVRILGVPVITVAAPVVRGGGNGPDAEMRAQVIEGNLEFLYRPRTFCSSGEALAELLVRRLFDPQQSDGCRLANAGLLGAPEALRVAVVGGGDAPIRLEARVPGRQLPLPLLTVTPEDARLNGLGERELADRWQELLERRLRVARRLMTPALLQQRLERVVFLELGLILLALLALGLWRLSRRATRALERRHGLQPARSRHRLAIRGLHQLSRLLLVGATLLLLVMAGVGAIAVPGQVPMAFDLLLQPLRIAFRLVQLWVVSLAVRALLALWLRQWVAAVGLPTAQRLRRRRRQKSLGRVLGRLVDLGCLTLAMVWIFADLPGFRALPGHALLASGAVVGALAIVFQGLLRDFVAGLVILFDDRYAIGDTVQIRGVIGEVVELGLLSTELRCTDQRLAQFQNGQCGEVVNFTKLRSGVEVVLWLSHRCRELRRALAAIEAVLRGFGQDPGWRGRLQGPPRLLGVSEVSPQGIAVAIVATTEPGHHGEVGRELRLRLVERLQRQGVPLAQAEEAAGTSPPGGAAAGPEPKTD
jgi:small conductance mechanosensitive channel